MHDVIADYDLLMLPGLGNAGADHWQSHWCRAFANATRVLQDDWDAPDPTGWLKRLDAAIAGGERPAILVCHSLSCALAAHWANRNSAGRVKAAFLVAPSDVDSAEHTPDTTRSFAPIPTARFPVLALVVASGDDPFVPLWRAKALATVWGADFCDVGLLGHINSTSRLGVWPQGLVLLGQLVGKIDAPVRLSSVYTPQTSAVGRVQS